MQHQPSHAGTTDVGEPNGDCVHLMVIVCSHFVVLVVEHWQWPVTPDVVAKSLCGTGCRALTVTSHSWCCCWVTLWYWLSSRLTVSKQSLMALLLSHFVVLVVRPESDPKLRYPAQYLVFIVLTLYHSWQGVKQKNIHKTKKTCREGSPQCNNLTSLQNVYGVHTVQHHPTE